MLDKAVCRGRCLILPDGKGLDGSLEAEYFQNDLIDWNHLTFKFHVISMEPEQGRGDPFWKP